MRSAVIVHYNNHEFIKDLDKNLFNVYYNSKKFNYVYLYFNSLNKQKVLDILNKLESTIDVEDSLFGVENIIINGKK